jgi:hypothetical protein
MTVSDAALQPRWPTFGWVVGELRIYVAVALACAFIFAVGSIVVAVPILILGAIAILISATFAIVPSIIQNTESGHPNSLSAYVFRKYSTSSDFETRGNPYMAEIRAQSARLPAESERLIREIEALRTELEADERQFRKKLAQRRAVSASSTITRSARRRINRSAIRLLGREALARHIF